TEAAPQIYVSECGRKVPSPLPRRIDRRCWLAVTTARSSLPSLLQSPAISQLGPKLLMELTKAVFGERNVPSPFPRSNESTVPVAPSSLRSRQSALRTARSSFESLLKSLFTTNSSP